MNVTLVELPLKKLASPRTEHSMFGFQLDRMICTSSKRLSCVMSGEQAIS